MTYHHAIAAARKVPPPMTVPRVSIALLLLLALGAGESFAQSSARGPGDAYSAVDPFIGTQDGGHTFPGATVPFGMIQLSPDTQTNCLAHLRT